MKIESGIPIPRSKLSRYDQYAAMQPGESVLCESESQANGMRAWMCGRGWSTTTRKIAGEGWRVWRVEDKKPKFGLRAVG
jgi:hypothetical protein